MRCSEPNQPRKGNPMTQPFEQAGKFGKEFTDNGLKSFAALSKGAQAITVEATEYTKKAFEHAGATVEKLLSAKSLEKAIEIQTDYLRTSYENFVAGAVKIGDLYADLAREAYKPFEEAIAKAK